MKKREIRLLLIEDRCDSCLDTQKLIDELNTRASSAREPLAVLRAETLPCAERHLQEDSFDVILLDLELGSCTADGGGQECHKVPHTGRDEQLALINLIRQFAGNVPLVVQSEDEDLALFAHALEQGANELLVKRTITPELLYRVIRQARLRHQANERGAGSFAATAHEKTPLTSVTGFAEALKYAALVNVEHEQALEGVLRSSRHLGEIIRNVLDVSKLEAGMPAADTAPCSPVQIIVELESALRPRGAEKALPFDIISADELPDLVLTPLPPVVLSSLLEDEPELARAVLGYIERLPERFAELKSAQAERDWTRMQSVAHKLAAGGLFGYEGLAHLAAALECELQEEAAPQVEELVAELAEAIDGVSRGKEHVRAIAAAVPMS